MAHTSTTRPPMHLVSSFIALFYHFCLDWFEFIGPFIIGLLVPLWQNNVWRRWEIIHFQLCLAGISSILSLHSQFMMLPWNLILPEGTSQKEAIKFLHIYLVRLKVFLNLFHVFSFLSLCFACCKALCNNVLKVPYK